MKNKYKLVKFVLYALIVLLPFLIAIPVGASITPNVPFQASTLAAPNPAVFTWVSSIAYYDGQLIYPGDDRKIYAYDIQTGNSTEVLDLSADPNFGFGPSGFLVSYDNYLYFLDNGNTDKIYRIDLTAAWPPAIESFSTGASGSIFGLTQNPWTDAVWFASADFPPGNMYLYEMNASFTTATETASFAQPNGGGNGPIIFKGATTLLYGESVWGGDGYFHLVDSTTGEVTAQDYLTFPGGLAGACYGYNNVIYASSGAGSTIYEIQGAAKTQVATTDEDAQSIVFDGSSFYISEQKSSDFSGAISFHQLWRKRLSGVPADQMVDNSVDLNGDGIPDNEQMDIIMSVITEGGTGSKQIGVSAGGADVFVETVSSSSSSAIGDTRNMPESFPFGLVNFRLKVTRPDGTATAVVYLSEPAAEDARWYKYDPIDGWMDYSAHATFSADRRSITIELKDGDYGDLDHVVNGEILDPSGLGSSSSSGSTVVASGGGGGGCFIGAVLGPTHWNWLITLIFSMLALFAGAYFALTLVTRRQ